MVAGDATTRALRWFLRRGTTLRAGLGLNRGPTPRRPPHERRPLLRPPRRVKTSAGASGITRELAPPGWSASHARASPFGRPDHSPWLYHTGLIRLPRTPGPDADGRLRTPLTSELLPLSTDGIVACKHRRPRPDARKHRHPRIFPARPPPGPLMVIADLAQPEGLATIQPPRTGYCRGCSRNAQPSHLIMIGPARAPRQSRAAAGALAGSGMARDAPRPQPRQRAERAAGRDPPSAPDTGARVECFFR
jgi:hypothetical protein